MTTVVSPVLDAMSARDHAALMDHAVVRRLDQGQRLYLTGERLRRVHVLISGLVTLSACSAAGDETILCLAVPGELVGEVAGVDGLPQPLDAVAAAPSEVAGLDADHLAEVLGRNPRASLELARLMAQRTRWMCETALERSTGEVPARLAGRLLDLADMLGRIRNGAIEMDLPLAQGDLGRLAGMCRESACKTLRSFKAAGMVDYRGRRLRILRPDALQRIKCAGRAAVPSPSEAAAARRRIRPTRAT